MTLDLIMDVRVIETRGTEVDFEIELTSGHSATGTARMVRHNGTWAEAAEPYDDDLTALLRDVAGVDDHRLWPEQREHAEALLYEALSPLRDAVLSAVEAMCD